MPGRSSSAARTSPRSDRRSACERGLARTFQINTLFAGLNALEAVTLAVCRTARRCRPVLAQRRPVRRGDRRSLRNPAQAEARRRLLPGHARTALWPSAPARDRAGARHQAESAAARRAGGRRAAGGKRRNLRGGGGPVGRPDPAVHRARHARGVPLRHATSSCWSAARSSPKVRRPKSPPIPACAKSIWASANMAEPLLKLDK